ncbi:MAG: nickel ABC transporter permease subunit NikC [Desulfatitalea sp.]|nr:nickel ABC transporter permease subunit NikC [Desulfatitalea sp.]NNK02857.1 nickel ABC transporter permease subunit NikC [Desulfatitalea sp.]
MHLIKTLLRRKLNWVALPLMLLFGFTALLAPWLAPHDPEQVDLSQRLAAPGAGHLLGTDHLGRDILSRLIWGARVSLGSVLIIISLVMLLSLVVGCASGFMGGITDSVLMRICEVFLSFPTFILAMFLIAVLGMGMTNVVLAIVLTHWAWYARIIRSLVLGMKHREYILAARVAGTAPWRLFVRHLAPSILAQLLILATLDIGHMMLHVSGLSFLGLGVQPPTPEWGVMISDARQYIWTYPEQILFPGAMIFLAVMAFNIPGDTLRDSLDPVIRAEEV